GRRWTLRPLADPRGRLREALGLAAGGWLLIRPDGYVAAAGPDLTEAALSRALAPLRLGQALRPHPASGAPRVDCATVETSTRVREGAR
ncbi:hypothetical protein GPJ59_05335, partial [Streptomyces bambusae]|nr:hypothetical protein [Streptomyces bambusae]